MNYATVEGLRPTERIAELRARLGDDFAHNTFAHIVDGAGEQGYFTHTEEGEGAFLSRTCEAGSCGFPIETLCAALERMDAQEQQTRTIEVKR